MILFWLPLLLVLASWELVLIMPGFFVYFYLLNFLASIWLSFRFRNPAENSMLAEEKPGILSDLPDKLLFVLFCSGVFWWNLWIDFSFLKYVFPVILWVLVVYLFKDVIKNQHKQMPPKMRLSLFLGNIFFWANITLSLFTILGWSLWLVVLLFFAVFAILGWTANSFLYLKDNTDPRYSLRSYLLFLLLVTELFAVIIWLPFSEFTLALILTIGAMFVYDFLKYYIQPDYARKLILFRKFLAYAFLLGVVLISTPWH